MAKIEEIVDGSKSSRPAKKTVKKAAKPTLSFSTEPKVITVIDDISAKKEIIAVNEPVFSDVIDSLESVLDEGLTSPIGYKADVELNTKTTSTIAQVVDQTISPVEETPSKSVSDYAAGFGSATKPQSVNKPATAKPFHKDQKPYDKKQSSKDIMPPAGMYPDHMVKIALIVKLNAEIRRFTALGILNYLLQKGEIKGAKRYVSFKWNKFTVKADNLVKEYAYTEPFFLNCLAASFSSFSASAQRVIEDFTAKEFNAHIDDVLSNDEVEKIVNSNHGK